MCASFNSLIAVLCLYLYELLNILFNIKDGETDK